MKIGKVFKILCLTLLLVSMTGILAGKAGAKKELIELSGLLEPVEIIKDSWGISHIYARNQEDLFFAQGFNVARDRIFQLEVWRRQATGTMAEILGPKALQRDIGARLLKARLDMEEELNHYHPQGKEIISSFVRGINAYIDLINQNPDLLPLEFRLLGITPGHWTPEVVVSRHNGLFRNARSEVAMAQAVQIMGVEKVKSLSNFHPSNPPLKVAEGLDLSLISPAILELYSASRSRMRFESEDIVNPAYRAHQRPDKALFLILSPAQLIQENMQLGSNNWVIGGRLTSTAHPMMANDPHRTQQVPSLRYWVHLVAPGWNVVGGGEPALPGVSIGHNAYGAWGLTIFSIDQEDLYVYQTNPENSNQYLHLRKWEDMKVIREEIKVKGQEDFIADLKFTRHGPVLYEDKAHHIAYALRAGWLEVGGAPYLASLRMNQAKSWQEFREACSYSRTPSENMVWADTEDNIGWQAVGITPIRKNWTGLLPVPGDGRFEWQGYLPIKELPHAYNPEQGFLATANQYNIPEGYPHVVGYEWTDPFRFARIQEVLSSGKKLTMTDMMNLQQDVLSIPARRLVPLLKGLHSSDEKVRKALEKLLAWDYVMNENSVEAAIFVSWQRRLARNLWSLLVPEEAWEVFPPRSLEKMIELLKAPDERFGSEPVSVRDDLLIKSLEQGVSDLIQRLGPDTSRWQYGQARFHHIRIQHLLSRAVNEELRAKLDVGPLPRGGNGFTVNNTSNGDNQTSGASFRIIADLSDWDNSVGTNSPGQSGAPENPHYADLFIPWAKGNYFPVYFSRSKVESAAEGMTILKPKK